MKILFLGISGYEYPHVRVRCYKFAEQLEKHGIEAEVLSFRDHLAPEIPEPEMYRLRDRKKLTLVFRSILKMLINFRSFPYLQKLHYHTAGALLLHRFFNRPYILDYDDYEIGSDPFGIGLFCGFNHRWWNRLVYGATDDRTILKIAARQALACITSSHALTDLLKSFNPNTYLVQTGVDTALFTPGERKHPRLRGTDLFVFLWTGLIWGETIAENLFFAVDALQKVRGKCPGAVLRIIGGGPFTETVIRYAREKLPDAAVEFVSWVDPDKMPEMLRNVDAGLLPMIRDIEWTRSKSPTKLFEYLAAGLPVVASPTGEVNHVIINEKNGFFASDLDHFADAMIRLCFNPDEYSRLCAEARNTAESEYSQAVLGTRLASILKNLEKNRP